MEARPLDGFPSSLRIGGVGTPELILRLRQAGIRLNPLAEQLFADPRFGTSPEARVVEIAAVAVADLGFDGGATFAQLVGAAAERGLSPCPLELGAHLRLQFTGQAEPVHEPTPQRGRAPPGSLTVASVAPPDEAEVPWGFYLRRAEGALWLRGYTCWSGHVWAPGDVLVFLRGRAD